MDAAGLAIAVFHEVFDVCVFITQTITDASNHDEDFGRLEFEFTHQQAILATFGRRFIESKFIHELEDCWITQLKRILDELKQVVGEYARLAMKYSEGYKGVIKDATPWWKLGGGQKGVNRQDLRLEPTGLSEPPKSPKKTLGFRGRLSRTFTQLEWALFDFKKLEAVVTKQKSWTGKLVDIMKLTLLPLPRFSNNTQELQELGKDAKTLGFSKLTNTRLLILDPAQGGQTTKIEAKSVTVRSTQPPVRSNSMKPTEVRLSNATLDGSEVLVEYKRYVLHSPQIDLQMAEERIGFLSKLLGVVGDEDEATINFKDFNLHCLGYFHEPEMSRFGLAFNIPQGYDITPLSLHSGITTLTKDTRPTLGQRFEIAYTIGYALMEWFLIGWVHKSINSHNVYFFRKTGKQLGEWDFSSPYLGGFEYARPLLRVSNEAYGPADFHTNVYRHPARQGFPSEGFRKTHDIYAFGVMLLEIGLWTVASSRELFKDELLKPDAIKEVLVKNARGRLGHFMGRRYQEAVLFCLDGVFQMGGDENQTKLVSAFKENVLDVCEEGKRLL